jgi:tRNA A-37 threonylcarbamoyl transferase component Bud32
MEHQGPSAAPSGYERIEEGDAVLVVKAEYAEPVRRVFSPIYQAFARIAQRRFTARGRTGIVTFPLKEGESGLVVRRYAHGGLFAGVGRDLYVGPERGLQELRVAVAAQAGGVRTAEPVGILAQKAWGPFWRMAYLSVEIADSEDMVHYCCRLADYPAETAAREKRGVLTEAAAQIRLMHDRGIHHADLHLKNLLLRRREAGTPEVFVIDFDKAELGPELDLAQRLRNLDRLSRSVRKVRVADAVLTAWDRLRFLRAYLKGHPRSRELMRRWAKRLARSGSAHEVWWTATGAKRSLRGDQVKLVAGLRKSAR